MESLNLCKYADIFGKPGTGLHSFRLCDFAVVDVLLTVALAVVITSVLPNRHRNKFPIVMIFCFLLGIVSHRIFCVKTTLDKLIFA
jgi:hypothetical protein